MIGNLLTLPMLLLEALDLIQTDTCFILRMYQNIIFTSITILSYLYVGGLVNNNFKTHISIMRENK